MNYLFKNISELITCKNNSGLPKKGKLQSDIGLIKNGFLHLGNKKILFAGDGRSFNIYRRNANLKRTLELDCKNKTVMPGFIDSHTHFVFAGSRADEYEMRISGKTYEEIAAKGGGIQSTVNAVKNTSKVNLLEKAEKTLSNFVSYGTTSIEGKSGYGLDFKNEVKMLEVINKLSINNKFGLDIFPTFLGAHSIPKGVKKRDYIDEVCYKMIPYIAVKKLAQFIDVFCEKNYFSAKETDKILSQGVKFGLIPKIHSDQFNSIGGVTIALKNSAISIDHLEVLKNNDIKKLSGKNIIATLLPGASYFLDIKYPPARKLIESNVPVSIATDFNPGSCMTENIQIMMSLASIKMKMSAEEIINGVTYNAACALNTQNYLGSIEQGKQADILLFDFKNHKDLIYHFGVNQIIKVFKKGKILF